MKWRGATEQQREAREREGIRRFAVLPTEMADGTWAWLEHYWQCRREEWPPRRNQRVFHVYRALTRNEAERLASAPKVRPPPPRPTNGNSVMPHGSGAGAKTGGGRK